MPAKLQEQLVKDIHEAPVYSHQGMDKTIK